MPPVINSLGVDTPTHMQTNLQSNFRNQVFAGHRAAQTWFKSFTHVYIVYVQLHASTLVESITVLVKVEPTNSITLILNNELVYTTGLVGGAVVL